MNKPFIINICLFDEHPPVTSIDPSSLVYYIDQFVLYNIADTLVRYDENNQLQAQIAKEWHISNDNKKITFVLREDARFSDGKLINSEDVAASFKRHLIKKSIMHFKIHEFIVGADKINKLSDDVEGIEILSSEKIQFSFKESIPDILKKLSLSEFVIVPYKNINKQDLTIDWGVTSGAYYIKSWSPEKFILEQNKYSVLYSSRAPFQVTSLINHSFYDALSKISDNQIQLMSLKVPLSINKKLFVDGKIIKILTRKFEWNNFIVLNPYADIFKDIASRSQVADRLANIDISNLPEEIFNKAHEIFPDGLLGHVNIRPVNKIKENAVSMQFTLLFPEMHKELKGEYLQQKFIDVGLDVKIKYLPYEKMHENVRKGKYEAAFMVAGTSAQFPDAFFTFFQSKNTPYLVDPENKVPKLTQKMIVSDEVGEKLNYIKEATLQLLNQATFIPLFFETVPIIINKNYYFDRIAQFGEDIPLWQFRIQK